MTAHERGPLERIKDWNEFNEPVPLNVLQDQGARCMGLRYSDPVFLPHRRHSRRGGGRMSRAQSDSGMERSGLPRRLGRSARPAAQDKQLSGVHRTRLPRPMRRVPVRSASTSRRSPSRRSSAASSTAGSRRAWVTPLPPKQRTGKSVASGRQRTGRPGRRRSAQFRRTRGDRLRTSRSHRRVADVRHPEHEARKRTDRRAASEGDGAGGDQICHQLRDRQGQAGRRTERPVRTPSSWPPGRRGRVIWPSPVGSSPAFTSRWSF